jgi:hypothetical protein
MQVQEAFDKLHPHLLSLRSVDGYLMVDVTLKEGWKIR